MGSGNGFPPLTTKGRLSRYPHPPWHLTPPISPGHADTSSSTSSFITFLSLSEQRVRRGSPQEGQGSLPSYGGSDQRLAAIKFWASTFQWTHSRPQGDLKASHTGTRIPLPSQGHHTDTGLASCQAGLLAHPQPGKCPGSAPGGAAPEGKPQSAQRGSMFTGALARRPVQGSAFWCSTAARALPRDLWR